MVAAMPDVGEVRDALAAFRAALTASGDRPTATALTPTQAARVHADCVALVGLVEEARDAALALARSAGATWERLETTSGVADSTLRDRLTRWEGAAR